MTRKKILFVIPSLTGGGAEKVLSVVMHHIDRKQFSVSLLVFKDINAYGPLPEDIKFTCLNKKGRLDNLRLISAIRKVIKTERPDVVCSYLYYSNVMVSLALSFCMHKPPVVMTEHSILSQSVRESRFVSIYELLIKTLYKKAACIVAVSSGIKEDLVENFGISGEIIQTIHNPIESDSIQALASQIPGHPWFDDEIPVLVSCGRLSAAKNFPLLLKSVGAVLKKTPVRLIIIGNGELKNELVLLAEGLGISKSVDFIGFRRNPFKYFSNSAILILTSTREGFGNVIVEAMACGVPVVSTRSAGPEDLIHDGVNGILVSNGDERALAEAILKLLEDETFRKRIAEAGRKRALDFDLKNIIQVHERLFHEVGDKA